jgi:hypothetical protein
MSKKKKKKKIDEWGDAWDAIEDRIEVVLQAKGQEKIVLYSSYDEDDEDNPVDNLDEVAAKGKVIFVCKYDGFWGEGKDYRSEVLKNPTWMQVALCANEMIKTTGDQHHVFLEGIQKIKEEDGVSIYKFLMGS